MPLLDGQLVNTFMSTMVQCAGSKICMKMNRFPWCVFVIMCNPAVCVLPLLMLCLMTLRIEPIYMFACPKNLVVIRWLIQEVLVVYLFWTIHLILFWILNTAASETFFCYWLIGPVVIRGLQVLGRMEDHWEEYNQRTWQIHGAGVPRRTAGSCCAVTVNTKISHYQHHQS